MAEIHWANAVSGDFTVAANWTGGVVPGPSDDVILDAPGPAYVVGTPPFLASESVNSVQLAANATLQADALTIANGTGSGANAGQLSLTLSSINGTFDNTGTISLQGDVAIASDATFTGGGSVALIDSLSSGTLTNVDNTITTYNDTSFSGTVPLVFSGTAALVNDSQGVVDFTGPTDFTTSQPVTNAGLVEATYGGHFSGDAIDNSGTVLATAGELDVAGGANAGIVEATNGGVIKLSMLESQSSGGSIVADGGTVELVSATIEGGALESENGGVLETLSGVSLLDGSTSPVSITGSLAISNATTLSIDGSIDNSAALDIASGGTLSVVADATLSGGGDVALSVAAISGASGAELTNVDNTITGAGSIGGGNIGVVNEAGGTIEATGPMTINTGANTLTNDGLIQAVSGASLTIDGSVANAGQLEVTGANLTANGAVVGGEAVIDGGSMDFASTFSGDVDFAGAGTLGLAQSQTYAGTITGLSTSGANQLDLDDIGFVSASEAIFSGTASGGVLTVTDGTHTATINLIGDYLGSTFIAAPDGHGGTTVGVPADFQWLNAANGSFDNSAAWSGGVVPLAIDNAILDASGAPYTVTQSGSADVVNSVQLASNATLVANGLTIIDGTGTGVNAGVLDFEGVTLGGTFDNTGQLVLGSNILFSSDVTLSGAGVVSLDDAGFNSSTAVTLTNDDNTISVTSIATFSGQITLVNEANGVINFSADTISRLITPISNAGLIEATNHAVFQDAAVDNSGTAEGNGGDLDLDGGTNSGLIEAVNGGSVFLYLTEAQSGGGVIDANGGTVGSFPGGATIAGGLIKSENGGTITCVDGFTFDGSTTPVTIEGVIDDDGSLTLAGSIDNTGVIALASGGGSATLNVQASGATLSGGGSVVLSAANAIVTGSAAAALINVDNMITGAGLVGGGELAITNEAAGVIKATGAMTLDTGSNTITNGGAIKAVGASARLKINSAVAGGKFKVSAGGTIVAKGAVTGGKAIIADGKLRFASTYTGDVDFRGSGTLVLADSQSYAGTITGLSTSGANTLDLQDIGFVSAGEANFLGTSSGGVLTVSDGTHTASLNLVGDYLDSTFTASSDGAGGVTITDPPKASAPGFASAMASLAPPAGSLLHAVSEPSQRSMSLLATVPAAFA